MINITTQEIGKGINKETTRLAIIIIMTARMFPPLPDPR